MEKHEGGGDVYRSTPRHLLEDKQKRMNTENVPVDKHLFLKSARSWVDTAYGYDFEWEPEVWLLESYVDLMKQPKKVTRETRDVYYRLSEKYGLNHPENK